MRENRIQRSILNYLRKKYPLAITWKIHEDPVFGVLGIPDILFVYDGDVFFFEVKRPGEDLTRIQESVMQRLKRNRAKAYVVRSVEEVKEIIKGDK